MRRKESLKTLEKKTTVTLVITLTIMITALATVYLTMLSTGAQNGYTLEMEKIRKQELYDNLQSIKNKITSESALTQLENNEITSKMKEASEKIYINN